MGSSRTSSPRDTLIPSDTNRTMFDGIAPHYDRMNQLMSLGLHRGWRRKAVHMLAPVAGHTYLEIGSGTGDLILELLRQQPLANIIGVDPSASMNAIARKKLDDRGIVNHVKLSTADYMTFTPPNGKVDGIISAFCIRNLEHLDDALVRMKSQTKSGGRVLALELTRPSSILLRTLCKLYNRSVIPLLAALTSDLSAYQYLTDSIDHFPSPESIRTRFHNAGLENVSVTPLTGGAVTVFSGTVAH
jgi:demethylmenaquinone methyltransferase/2-methoxy-6-polyprenyl-1,4-benzoquinol methylase